ncbi:AfsA-related hotdog domain-containing protein [Kitasatospora viridis]|uniref:A-factor biosynthesis hotdog protein n=1 Tax=Kitasatospora viridis TaxID=281105 RepID=A0A561UJU3_9ACTN|nr:AfsA-related hotdog domain-containing protein [Kitasatospora viridis]TWF99629.1 A-factor biosynthesis hotdog protein [Kitasatospora viridis]
MDTSPAVERPRPPQSAEAPVIQLVHRPSTRDGLLLNGRTSTEHAFVLSTVLPEPPLPAGSGLYELRSAIEAVRRACEFAAHQYFGVPRDSAVLPTETDLVITDLRPWRRAGRPAQATIDLRLRGGRLVDGVPGTLGCESTVSIDGVPCGRGRGRLTMTAPERARGHRPGRPADPRAGDPRTATADPRAGAAARCPAARFRPARPVAVGCGRPEEVVIGEPLSVSAGTVLVPVRPGTTPLDDALRQTALLAAGTLRGFQPARCAITRWSAAVARPARPDRPLLCTATPGAADRDTDGRPLAPVALRLLQDGRTLGSADVTVLLDC